jgi:amino acid transporter
MGGTDQTVQVTAAIAATALFGLAYAGADLATRFQSGIMLVLIAALASFFIGAGQTMDGPTLDSAWTNPESGFEFWVVFAIFFPAVTGFTQGVSMSGDLKNPAKSLPI